MWLRSLCVIFPIDELVWAAVSLCSLLLQQGGDGLGGVILLRLGEWRRLKLGHKDEESAGVRSSKP